MYESIKNFPKQFLWSPKVHNARHEASKKLFVVCGMGGSALAGDLLKISNPPAGRAGPKSQITIWRDYGLPPIPNSPSQDILIIASSYSGNTEETIDAFRTALKQKLPVAAITTGGELLRLAVKHRTSYIQLPNTGIQPRMATGYMIKALLAVMRLDKPLREASRLPRRLSVSSAERQARILARYLRGKLPIIYASSKNLPVAYNWKIKFNETAKIPAFCNAFPELNHNEMTGFSAMGGDNLLRLNLRNEVQPPHDFSFIFLEDSSDHPRIKKRMKITKKLLEDRGFHVSSFKLHGRNVWHKIFQNLLIADFAAYRLAKYYGHDPENVPMVEEFKKLMK